MPSLETLASASAFTPPSAPQIVLWGAFVAGLAKVPDMYCGVQSRIDDANAKVAKFAVDAYNSDPSSWPINTAPTAGGWEIGCTY